MVAATFTSVVWWTLCFLALGAVLLLLSPAVEEMARKDWQTAGALRGVLARWLARRPAGDRLQEPGGAEERMHQLSR
jgi:hypothetical protein